MSCMHDAATAPAIAVLFAIALLPSLLPFAPPPFLLVATNIFLMRLRSFRTAALVSIAFLNRSVSSAARYLAVTASTLSFFGAPSFRTSTKCDTFFVYSMHFPRRRFFVRACTPFFGRMEKEREADDDGWLKRESSL